MLSEECSEVGAVRSADFTSHTIHTDLEEPILSELQARQVFSQKTIKRLQKVWQRSVRTVRVTFSKAEREEETALRLGASLPTARNTDSRVCLASSF